MREIKFRAWDKKDKKMYKVAHMSNLLTVGQYVTVRKNEDGAIIKIERDLEEDEYSLMQYTGINDKNGKEIYEGDVLLYLNPFIVKGKLDHIENIKNVVEWDSILAGFGPFCHYDSDCQEYYPIDKCEVIGNIYENPELLEVRA